MATFVYTGNEINVYFAGLKVDLVQNMRCTDDYGPEPVSGVGDIHVREYPPTMARHSVAISRFALRKDTAVGLGIINENGDAALINSGKLFEIEVFSKLTGKLIKKYMGSYNGSSDATFTAHRAVVSDANFVCTDTMGDMSTG
jgi:hypothetical protein